MHGRYLGFSLALYLITASCVSIPPELVDSGQAIRDYTKALGVAHSHTVDQYKGIITSIDDRWQATTIDYIDAYESDVELLVNRYDELRAAYAEVTGHLAAVLDADGATTRASLIGDDLIPALKAGIAAEGERQDSLSAKVTEIRDSLTNEDFDGARQAVGELHAVLEQKSEATSAALQARIGEEYTALDSGLRDLMAYLRSLVRVEAERKRTLGRVEETANKLADKVVSSDVLGRASKALESFAQIAVEFRGKEEPKED